MAVRRQPLAIIHDENAEINRGKPSVAKSGGLKAQQPDLTDRKTLSNITNITNKLKPLPNLGNATPIVPRKENNNGKGGFILADPELLGKSGVKARGRIVPRNPLSNITNVESLQNSSKVRAGAMKEKKIQTKNVRMGPNPNYEVTEKMKQKAEVWAPEGIEKVNFSGKDMEALQEKMAEEEVDRRVAQALSYRTEIPCWLPRAFVKDPPEIKDHLEIDPVEDLYTKRNFFFHGMEKNVEYVDYDESYNECLKILENASKDWPIVVGESVC